MIHPCTQLRFIHEDIGHGVVASQRIARGTVTWVADPLDRVLSRAELAALPPALGFDIERHTFVRADGLFVMPWGLAAFVNHCCEPNCIATPGGFEIAVRDIEPGEQLSNDYANLGMHPGERFRCHCGVSGCRGLITDADVPALAPVWQAAIESALALAPDVEQPLADLLAPPQRRLIGAAGTVRPLRSSRA